MCSCSDLSTLALQLARSLLGLLKAATHCSTVHDRIASISAQPFTPVARWSILGSTKVLSRSRRDRLQNLASSCTPKPTCNIICSSAAVSLGDFLKAYITPDLAPVQSPRDGSSLDTTSPFQCWPTQVARWSIIRAVLYAFGPLDRIGVEPRSLRLTDPRPPRK